MAKNLTFSVNGKTYCAEPVKLDRKKLYGWQEKAAFDDEGKACIQAYTDESGALLIPKGGVGLGILSPEGEWVDRSSLKAVKPDGNPAELILSSYSAPITLHNTVTGEEFLNYTITGMYQLNTGKEFSAVLGEKIFVFHYLYRDGYESTPAFILQSGGTVFMLLGYNTCFEMLTLYQSAEIDDEEDDLDEDDDEIDFSMI
jgi:hypothetical protein